MIKHCDVAMAVGKKMLLLAITLMLLACDAMRQDLKARYEESFRQSFKSSFIEGCEKDKKLDSNLLALIIATDRIDAEDLPKALEKAQGMKKQLCLCMVNQVLDAHTLLQLHNIGRMETYLSKAIDTCMKKYGLL